MANRIIEDEDLVTRIIGHCHASVEEAENIFNNLISEKKTDLTLPDGDVHLNQEQVEEFVARYSAEVEPTLWVSKRGKD